MPKIATFILKEGDLCCISLCLFLVPFPFKIQWEKSIKISIMSQMVKLGPGLQIQLSPSPFSSPACAHTQLCNCENYAQRETITFM